MSSLSVELKKPLKTIFNQLPVIEETYRRYMPLTWQDEIRREFTNPYSALEEENEVIFIHIPKAAGNAVTQALFGQDSPGHFELNRYHEQDELRFFKYTKFGFVRNPWARLVSAFHFLKQGGKSVNDQRFSDAQLARFDDFESFAYALEDELFVDKLFKWIHFKPQYDFLSVDGKLQMDFIGKQECMEEDFARLKLLLNMPEATLKHVNTSSHNHFKSYYNDRTWDIVSKVYLWDIQSLGYENEI